MNWYYAENDQQLGPVTAEEFSRLIADGVIKDDTLVWTDGMEDWLPLSRVERMPSLLDEANMAFCAESGQLLPRDEMVKFGDVYVAAAFKDAYFQKLQEGVPSAASLGEVEYAGFWIRFLAVIIDGIILSVVGLVVQFVLMIPIGLAGASYDPMTGEPSGAVTGLTIFLMILMYLVSFAIGFGYEMFFLPKYGATPGKMAVGVRVCDLDGTNVSVLKAFGRYWGRVLSYFTFCIGFIIAAFDDEKRALHDHICSTRVVRK